MQYRDRAAERREVHHLPDRPALDPDPRRPKDKDAAPVAPAAKPPAPPAEDVGNKLLAKMGWTSGSGLGLNQDGRAEPIRVQQFEQRVGLGAAQGREAGRWSGPGGWQRRAQDMVRGGYKSLLTDRRRSVSRRWSASSRARARTRTRTRANLSINVYMYCC